MTRTRNILIAAMISGLVLALPGCVVKPGAVQVRIEVSLQDVTGLQTENGNAGGAE